MLLSVDVLLFMIAVILVLEELLLGIVTFVNVTDVEFIGGELSDIPPDREKVVDCEFVVVVVVVPFGKMYVSVEVMFMTDVSVVIVTVVTFWT